MTPSLSSPLVGEVLLTGGTGTLGHALVKRSIEQKWDCDFTIFSRDEMKQHAMKNLYPQCRYVIGDVADFSSLSLVMAGHDTVIHAAAFKHIPSGEVNVMSMLSSNYIGSLNVALAAIQNNVKLVVGISTDKACHPINAYGASKMLMEKMFQHYATQYNYETRFVLCRYGNVLGSTGSVIPVWRKMLEENGFIEATSPDMTRFFFTIDQAVDVVEKTIELCPNGWIYIPKLKSISMGRFGKYIFPDARFEYKGMRAGEKMHEELLSVEERQFAKNSDEFFIVSPSTYPPCNPYEFGWGYSSDNANTLYFEELLGMVS